MTDSTSSVPAGPIDRALAEAIEQRFFYRLLPDCVPREYEPPSRPLLIRVEASLRGLR